MKQIKKFSLMLILFCGATNSWAYQEFSESVSYSVPSTLINRPTAHKNVKTKKDNDEITKNEVRFEVKGEKVLLSYTNSDLNSISITVRDGRDRLIYSETISAQKSVKRSFNFESAFQGFYQIKVDTGGQKFNKEIEIQ